jgi:hypothetical protein
MKPDPASGLPSLAALNSALLLVKDDLLAIAETAPKDEFDRAVALFFVAGLQLSSARRGRPLAVAAAKRFADDWLRSQ